MLANMLTIKEITNKQAAEFFLNDPKLAYLGCADDVLVNLYYTQEFIPHEISQLKGIYNDNQLIMLFKYEPFSSVAYNCHFYLNSALHGTGQFNEIVLYLKQWMHENNPEVKKILVMTPSSCTHVPAVVSKYGFIKEGHLTNAIIWRQQLVDLLIYSLEL